MAELLFLGGAGLGWEGPGRGRWDGAVDPEVGNTCLRKFMRWYRQRLNLSLHQVEALTGINRASMRRLERRRIQVVPQTVRDIEEAHYGECGWTQVYLLAHASGRKLPHVEMLAERYLKF